MESALSLYAANGYDATSMGDIGARAGVTRAVLYDHFDSKKDLYLTLLQEQNAAFLGHVGARITGAGRARDRMRETMATVFEFAEHRPDAWALLFGNQISGDPATDAEVSRIAIERERAVGALLKPDAESAGIDPALPRFEVIVAMLIAALRGAVEWWRRHPEASSEELLEAGIELLSTGLDRGP